MESRSIVRRSEIKNDRTQHTGQSREVAEEDKTVRCEQKNRWKDINPVIWDFEQYKKNLQHLQN